MLKKSILLIAFTGILYTSTFSQNSKANAPVLQKNIISLNVLNLINFNTHVGYERIFGKERFGAKLSVNYNVKDRNLENSPLNYQRDFTTGIDFNVYLNRKGAVRYFIGSASRFGVVSNGDVSTRNRDFSRKSYWGVFINNGIVIIPYETIYLGFQAAIGTEFLEPLDVTPGEPTLSRQQLGGFAGIHIGVQL